VEAALIHAERGNNRGPKRDKDMTNLTGALHDCGNAPKNPQFTQFGAVRHSTLHVRTWLDDSFTGGWIWTSRTNRMASAKSPSDFTLFMFAFGPNKRSTGDNKQHKVN
jgi:hypothetical protein